LLGLTKTAPGPGNLALVDRPEPSPPAGHVLIDVHATGVCGTDLHLEAGEYACAVPVVLGHEVSGVVADVGQDVEPEWLGARVVSETFFSVCHACRACRANRPNLCPERRSIGIHVDGAFTRRLVVPSSNLHRVPEWLDDNAATLTEPLACVCHALLDPLAVNPGDRVLVVGPGPIGLLAGQVARAMEAEVVVSGLERDQPRLEIAAGLGLSTAIAGEDLEEVDVAIECSGSPAGAQAALDAVRSGGTYVQFGIFGKPVVIDVDRMVFKELDVRTPFASTPQSWRQALELIERRMVDLPPMVTGVMPLEAWSDGFAALRSGRETKVVLDPRPL
jgi:L-iditol 2-dehydrogenase